MEIRKEESKRKHEERDKIINAQTHNKKVFYQMIRKQRNNRNVIINDLYVDNNNYDGDNRLKGWHEHFQNLAQPADDPSYNNQYKQQCQTDYSNIKDIYKNIPPKIITMEELENAIKAINTGKSENIYGLSIENIIYAGEYFQLYMLDLINNIISQYSIPELIKVGLLSPKYKNKGDKSDSKNYRGIVVLPILCKILEHIARNNFRTILTKQQSPLQRGFTTNTSPLNTAIVIEEVYREYSDRKAPFYLALLDAKSAFDVVDIDILMRKLFLLGVQPSTWKIIDELHQNTKTCVKWKQQTSETFSSHQGVKQGGLLSAELYKLYIEDLLKTYENSKLGCHIGTLTINAIACADDITLVCDNPYDLQVHVNQAVNYSNTHRYKLQPQKSVIIEINNTKRNHRDRQPPIKINQNNMPVVEKSAPLGILRSKSKEKTEATHIERNITKARRTAYSLLSAGFHGVNGLDPMTSLSLYKTYIQPVLTYGLEIVQPKQSNLVKLELFQKTILKQILSLPINTPDPTAYIISGLLPVEAIIDIKCMSLFNNICRQSDNAIEKQLAMRQLLNKSTDNRSWFINIKKILLKYEFSNINELLTNPIRKSLIWKSSVQRAVENFWTEKIRETATWYPSLEHLNSKLYAPKLPHPIIDISKDLNTSRASISIGVKLKIVTGTYPFQGSRAKYSNISPICELCGENDETLEHFLLECKLLYAPRSEHLSIISDILASFDNLDSEIKVQMLTDCTKLRSTSIRLSRIAEQQLELNSRKMCYALHCIRTMSIIPRRKKVKRKR